MKKTSILFPTVLTLLLLWLICNISNYNAGILPQAVQYRNIDSPDITFDDTLRLNHEDVIISAQSIFPGVAENPVNNEAVSVKIITTDENYPLIQPAKMMAGKFWDSVDGTTSLVAVLNEGLAIKLFKSADIIGREVIINSSRLIITGVCKDDKSFISQISSDGTDTVYIPYNANVQGTSKTAQDIYMQQNIDGVTRAPEFSRYSIINQSLNGVLSEYSKTDYFAQSRILLQMRSIGFFILGIAAIILLIRIVVRMFSDNTFGQIDIRKQIRFSVMAGMALAAGAAVFWLVSFELFIPSHLIPPDGDILNLRFYYHEIIKSLQVRNANPPDYYGNIAFYAFWILGLLVVAFAGGVVMVARRITKFYVIK